MTTDQRWADTMTQAFTFRRAIGVPQHWLPVAGIRDPLTEFYCIAMRPDGTLEACSAPGLWHSIAPTAAARYAAMLEA
jgi:hypothetical protein